MTSPDKQTPEDLFALLGVTPVRKADVGAVLAALDKFVKKLQGK